MSKWSSIDLLPFPVTIKISSIPAATASSTTYCMVGLLKTGNISFGCALVAGKNLVPSPAAGITAFILNHLNFLDYEKFLNLDFITLIYFMRGL